MNGETSIISNYITEEDVKKVVKKCGFTNSDVVIKDYEVYNASDKMLGFLCDYWKLKIRLIAKCDQKTRAVLSFFIKAISKSNSAKATKVREWDIFQKELFFYSVIKNKLELKDMKPWSAKLITPLTDAMVFEDLNAMQYKCKCKFERFDMAHTLKALNTLARFHASSIIYEEQRSKILQERYSLNNEYGQFLNEGGYRESDCWFRQCMTGALEAIKVFSKYAHDERVMYLVEQHWKDIWFSALQLSDFSSKYRNVICHRDLWNNNILFRYKEVGGKQVPQDCVLVDFQAVRCQPPAGDVMVLLCCNLDPKYREEHLNIFLNHYYTELKAILSNYSLDIEHIMTEKDFFESAEIQRKWGLVVCACLIPQFWIDDTLTTEVFCDTEQFFDILSENKGTFIKKMMQGNQDYRNTVMEIFEEIIDRYCIGSCE